MFFESRWKEEKPIDKEASEILFNILQSMGKDMPKKFWTICTIHNS
jgi:hypothetical protein